ncbi:peptidase M75, Imelysin [Maribrevibacterium harenarium]|uniref:Peptidase M75, Imelysin n=1 Tax=Maribrevibacterium harenarium TaxID=2589817 RepID=A0A501WG50_9GAMM|nr:imelysin family protein [Maribrevibacterium harenarium]TPE47340.1 peptidase M75, Imelysin [Maribrevibacterium harenarium]
MKYPRNLSALACSVALCITSHSYANDWSAAVAGIQADVIQPAYNNLARDAQQLQQAVAELCLAPTEPKLQKVKQQFITNIDDWQQIQWLNFGPVTYFMRYYAMEYWPDKKGITRRQLQGLSKTPEVMTDKDFWHSASIAVRGLTAIETLLYHPDFNVIEHAADCHVLTGVSEHHAATTLEIAKQWSESKVGDWVFLDEDSNSSPDHGAMELFVQQWIEHLSAIKDSKLETPIGYNGRANLKLAEFYRSQQSLPAIIENLATYPVLFHAGQPSLYELAKRNDGPQAEEMDRLFQQSVSLAKALPDDFFSGSYSQQQRVELARPLVQSISQSQDKLVELVTSLGFNIGFNSRDGD